MKSNNRHLYQLNFLEKKLFFDKKKIKYWVNEFSNWLFCTQKEYINYQFFEEKEIELRELLVQLLE